MLSPEEIGQIKVEIERLEKLRAEHTDGGIRKRIEAWIEAEKNKLSPANQERQQPPKSGEMTQTRQAYIFPL
jgi:hypothetical protein